MKKKDILFFSIFFLASSLAAYPQFKPEELAARPQWENFLKKAKIIKGETIGEGVTKSKKLLLRQGDVEASGIWKRPVGLSAELYDKWQCEIAAYRLDKLLGLNMIPPTVERRYRLDSGSLQLWVSVPLSEQQKVEEKIAVPEEMLDHYEKMRALQRAFDSLIANSDRTFQNLRYTEDWRLILIDHSRAFRDFSPFLNTLMYGKKGIRPTSGFGPLPRAFVEKVRGLNHDRIRSVVEDYLTGSEIKAMLTRRDLLLKEIDEAIKEEGENKVLYKDKESPAS
jgi:hypothetical protein